jgi:integrase/recombinase XerD
MLAAERGAAANTLAAYERDLRGAEDVLGDLEGRCGRAGAIGRDMGAFVPGQRGAQILGLAAILRLPDRRGLARG